MSKVESLPTDIDEIFAVGCFSFVAKSSDIDDDFYDSYSAFVRSALEKIDNVSDINVSGLDSFSDLPAHPTRDTGYSNIAFIPCPRGGSVSFEVFIPKRVQAEVFPHERSKLPCERFTVLVDFTGDFPFTIIKAAEKVSGDLSDGFSDFVPVVRNYLASRWPADADVGFACLGPSPFHADFYFKKADTIDFRIVKNRGYDNIVYQGPDIVDFYKEIRAVIPNFYYVIYSRNALVELKIGIGNAVRTVLSRLTERNTISRIRNSLGHSNKRDIADIYSMSFDVGSVISEVEEHITYVKRQDGAFSDSILWIYPENEFADIKRDSGSEVNQLLRLAEVFEMGGSTNSTTIFASLLSAILAALVALIIAVTSAPNSKSTNAQIAAASISSDRPAASK